MSKVTIRTINTTHSLFTFITISDIINITIILLIIN